MFLKSYSKINLSLNVYGKSQKEHKLHEIQSYYCLIDLFDEIKIKKNKNQKDKVKFYGKFSRYIHKENNTIKKVLSILRDKNLITNYYSVYINKKIPVFGGLGGGTGNAYYLAKHLTKNKISRNLLNVLNKKIGSDFNLFFYKKGFLKNIYSINSINCNYKLYFLLIYPKIKCSTKYIYSKINRYSLKRQYNFKKINNKSKFTNFLTQKENDLQFIVERKYPIINKLVTEIGHKKGCLFSRMTGSGSVCYGVFKSDKTAKLALSKIKLKYPNYWSSIAKTI